jgi:2-oxoglutarate ferredoxin oxidoreductase subunit gamma
MKKLSPKPKKANERKAMSVKLSSNRIEVRLAGEGGQGMILAGIILAEAAAIYDNKNAIQIQSYGPESRGGASKAEVIIGAGEIDFPEVIAADILVAVSQEACDKYASNLKKDGILIVDSDKVGRVPTNRAIQLPITQIAIEATGKSITANVVTLGILVGLTSIVSRPAIEKAVAARAPRGTEEMNLLALEKGFEAARQINEK